MTKYQNLEVELEDLENDTTKHKYRCKCQLPPLSNVFEWICRVIGILIVIAVYVISTCALFCSASASKNVPMCVPFKESIGWMYFLAIVSLLITFSSLFVGCLMIATFCEKRVTKMKNHENYPPLIRPIFNPNLHYPSS